jgi:hypothetical protein
MRSPDALYRGLPSTLEFTVCVKDQPPVPHSTHTATPKNEIKHTWFQASSHDR